MAMTTPDFRDGVAQVAKDVHDFANDLERASGVPVVTVTGAPDTTAGLFGTTASTLTDAVNSGTSLVPSPGSPLGYNPANFDRPIGGHNFSGNSAQNQANIAVTVIPPAGAMAAGPGMFAVGSISAAIQAGIENGILDSWMPGTAAWNVLWSEHEYTTTDYSPDSPSSYGGRGGETRE